ncbi:hypothetical protein M2139_002694 [Enterococcus sp. PF1-24]|uniref:SMI1/KNR4 family protein n=1 Tax=unclassified Enterococcus TaxID=2608891 RepID=UPI002473601A|nr:MULTISPECIES: SMI1/KNR4 family protein [unclassified Enterococcus]MDH6365686.1 hypothetical protein [Enterococcus sp. PFB1-1]MDH6402788.1 hypothetical protein [Enterococcus sp. PF1-24]
MLELFETIHKKHPGCTQHDIKELEKGLAQLGFENLAISKTYAAFLMESNGGIFTNGKRAFQLFSSDEVLAVYKEYHFADFMPYALPISLDGSGNFSLFDYRKPNNETIYCASAGNLGWEQDEVFLLADNFTDFLTQKDELFDYM